MTTGSTATGAYLQRIFLSPAGNRSVVNRPDEVFRYFGEKNFFTLYEGCVA